MRFLGLFVCISLAATAVVAQPAPATAPDTALTADGKIKLGLDGRGNYRKPKAERKALEPAASNTAQKSAFVNALGGNTRNPVNPVNSDIPPVAAMPGQAPDNPVMSDAPTAPAKPKKEMRSDKSLLSSSQEQQSSGGSGGGQSAASGPTPAQTAVAGQAPSPAEAKKKSGLRSDKSILTVKPVAPTPANVTPPMGVPGMMPPAAAGQPAGMPSGMPSLPPVSQPY